MADKPRPWGQKSSVPDRPQLAEKITVDKQGLLFDNRRLPFLVAAEPISVQRDPDGVCKITVTFLADGVEIDPTLRVEGDDEIQWIEL